MSEHTFRLRRRGAGVWRRGTSIGNARSAQDIRSAVSEALGVPVRTKLTLGAPGDAQEREADATAERVMRMPQPGQAIPAGQEPIQRKCDDCTEEEPEQVRRAVKAEEEDKEEEEPVQRKEQSARGTDPQGATAQLDPNTAARVQARRGAGGALPESERTFFEPRFGRGFGAVRLHTDGESAELARSMSARAFTVGRDVFFGADEYRPGTAQGRQLLAHELTHVLQQGSGESATLRRWQVGSAPAPHGWQVVSDAAHLRRLGQAESIVSGVLGSKNCKNYFSSNCTNGVGANALRDTFDKARVYLRGTDDNVFGEGEFGGHNLAFNLRAYRIGRYMMASTLLHEMFHNCDTTGAGTGRAAELSAENALETCRLHTPWIDTVSPRSGAVGSRVTIRGWGFGPTRGSSDEVRIGGGRASIVSWTFMSGTSSRVQIVVQVPAGASSGDLVVINNGVRSNAAAFTVV